MRIGIVGCGSVLCQYMAEAARLLASGLGAAVCLFREKTKGADS